jgi:hypothetical protein
MGCYAAVIVPAPAADSKQSGWIANDPAPIHECALSHYMADAQDDIADELAWDLSALNAGSERARNHIASARDVVGNLADDSHGQMIRRGIDRLEKKLGGI